MEPAAERPGRALIGGFAFAGQPKRLSPHELGFI